ncbi:hypothetical protein PVAP13_5NG009408 [Panicum virgatum]|uniref:Uncharacterized protein n=1 Tax=Panicum virgatum TaxID=38727 RepID=A0A8T0RIQ2_PANVG|nr:hypothetical protein PVAP13_5NG009408 [Panicum virgatum]
MILHGATSAPLVRCGSGTPPQRSSFPAANHPIRAGLGGAGTRKRSVAPSQILHPPRLPPLPPPEKEIATAPQPQAR